MKKVLSLVICVLMLVSILACSSAPAVETKPNQDTTQPAGTQVKTDNGTTTSQTTEAQGKTEATPVYGGTLRVGVMYNDATSMLTFALRQGQDYLITSGCYETLLRYNEEGDLKPFLCEEFNSDPATKSVTIKLREGIKFHDGSVLDAEVLKWNLDTYKETGVFKSSLAAIESVEVIDNLTCVLHLVNWDSTFKYFFVRGPGFIMSKKAYEENGPEYCATHPVGTGPFKFVSWDTDVKATFERFDDYWQGKPYLDKVEFIVYATDEVAQAAMEANEVDVIHDAYYTMVQNLAAKGFNISYSIIPQNAMTAVYCMTNPDDPCYDVRVRQAISHAVNGSDIVYVIGGETAVESNQYAAPGTLYYSDKVKGYEYNPEKAKELLKEAGYEKECPITIHVNGANTRFITCAQIIADQLEKVGFKVTLDTYDSAVGTAMVANWGDGVFIHSMYLDIGAGSQIANNYRQGLSAGLGITSFTHTDELNDIIVRAMAADDATSVELFGDASHLIFDEYCMAKAYGVFPVKGIKNPKVHDDGIDVISNSIATLWKCWIEQ